MTDKPDHPGAERLRRSAKYWGWDLKWLPAVSPERQLFRFQQLAQLEAIRKFEPDFLLYLDAWDTMFIGPPQELQLEKGVLSFCGDTILLSEVFAGAKNAAHLLPDSFPPVPSGGFRYVNDGVIWGDSLILQELAGEYLQHYDGIMNQDYFNSRLVFEHGMRRQRLQVDFEARTCINIMDIPARSVERQPNNRLLYKPFHTNPLIIHSPGSAPREPVAPMPKWMEEIYCGD